MRILSLILLLNCIVSGCYKRNLYVQQEWVDVSFLASSKVGTPDPRQADPDIGQRLIIAWDFPRSIFEKNLTLVATVRLWDSTQEIQTISIERKKDTIALFFSNKDPKIDRRILTYRVQVFSETGEEVQKWEHPFWTELIDIDRPTKR